MTTVHLSVRQPASFSRLHVFVRLLVLVTVSAVAGSHGWPGVLFYFGLPGLSALLISAHGQENFLAQDAKKYVRVLRWLIGFYAFLALLTDRFPNLDAEGDVRLDVEPAGTPTAMSAALRFFTSIPAVIALWLLGLAGLVVWIISATMVLVTEQYPTALFNFQTGVLRYHARFLAWHASLIDTYPASMSEHPEGPATTALQP